MAKRKLRHVPGSPVVGHPPEQQQVDSRYAVRDDEPIKRRQGEEAMISTPKERLLRRLKVMKIMRTSNTAAAVLSDDDQNYCKQKPKVAGASVDRFDEDLLRKQLTPKFLSSDDLLGKRLNTGHPGELFSCTEIPVGFSSLRVTFAPSFLKGLALPQDVSERIAFSLLTAVAGLHRNASAHHKLSPDTVLVGPGLQIKILRRLSAEEGLNNIEINANLGPPPISHVGAIEAEHGPPDGPKDDMYNIGSLLLMCTTGRAPVNLVTINERPDLKEVADIKARDLIRWLLHGKSAKRPEASQALRHPWLRQHTQRQQQIGMAGPAALFSPCPQNNTRQHHDSPVEILPGNPYGRLCQSMGGWASSRNPRREAFSKYRGENETFVSDGGSSDDSVHHVASSDNSPPMRRFSSTTIKGISKASGPPPPPPVLPLLPLLPIWAGDGASAISGAANGSDEHSSSRNGEESSSSSSSTGSCKSSKKLGATTGQCNAQAKGPSQTHPISDVRPIPDVKLPSSCGGGSLPAKTTFSSSGGGGGGGGGVVPLAFRKYAKKYSLPRGAKATITVAPPLVPHVREVDLASADVDEDRDLPWISTAVAAARGMASTATTIPITATAAAAALFRSHWG